MGMAGEFLEGMEFGDGGGGKDLGAVIAKTGAGTGTSFDGLGFHSIAAEPGVSFGHAVKSEGGQLEVKSGHHQSMFVSDKKGIMLASGEEGEGGGGTDCTYISCAIALATFGGRCDGGDGGSGGGEGQNCQANGQLDKGFNESAGFSFDHGNLVLGVAADVVGSSFNPLGDIFFFFSSPWPSGEFICQSERSKEEEGKDLAEEVNKASDRSEARKEAA
jgi:hypothetical protein